MNHVDVSPAATESWRHYLLGLCPSGLRLTDSPEVYWNRTDRLCIDLTGKRSMLRIPAELEKGHRDRFIGHNISAVSFLVQLTPPMVENGSWQNDTTLYVVNGCKVAAVGFEPTYST